LDFHEQLIHQSFFFSQSFNLGLHRSDLVTFHPETSPWSPTIDDQFSECSDSLDTIFEDEPNTHISPLHCYPRLGILDTLHDDHSFLGNRSLQKLLRGVQDDKKKDYLLPHAGPDSSSGSDGSNDTGLGGEKKRVNKKKHFGIVWADIEVQWPQLPLNITYPLSSAEATGSTLDGTELESWWMTDEDTDSGHSFDSEWGNDENAWEVHLPLLGEPLQAIQNSAVQVLIQQFAYHEAHCFTSSDHHSGNQHCPQGLISHPLTGKDSTPTTNSVGGSETPHLKRANDNSEREIKSAAAKKPRIGSLGSPPVPLMACPFAKHNPVKYQKCFKYVLKDISRLK
jgi:hypothetical protein